MAEQIYNLKTFVFVGTSKVSVKEGKNEETGNEWKRLSIGIEAGDSTGYAELLGSENKVVYSYTKKDGDKSGEALEVPWKDRFKGEILDTIASFKKMRVNLSEKKEFIASLDVIDYVQNNLEAINGKRLVVSGQIEVTEYKGKTQIKQIIQSIRLAKDEDKDQLHISATIYFDKNSLDKDEFKETKRAYISGYLKGYDKKIKKDRMYPQNFVLDMSKVDWTKPIAPKMADFLLKQFTLKKDKYYEIGFELRLVAGAEQEEIKFEDLTDYQQQQIDLGIRTLADFQKELGNAYGDTKKELRLIKPHAKYDSGAIETELTDDDFIVEDTFQEKTVNEKDLSDDILLDDLPFDDLGL